MENQTDVGRIDKFKRIYSENQDIIKYEGWLNKSPKCSKVFGIKSKWHRRWFVLESSESKQYFLTYYTNTKCRKKRGQIDVSKISHCYRIVSGFKLEDLKSKYYYVFYIKTSKRTYYLTTDSEVDMNKWIDIINRCIYRSKLFKDDDNDNETECSSVNNTHVSSNTEECSSLESIKNMSFGYSILSIPGESEFSRSSRFNSETSVFTNEEPINRSTIRLPLIKWDTFPSISVSSLDMPLNTPPPRPPKPKWLKAIPKPQSHNDLHHAASVKKIDHQMFSYGLNKTFSNSKELSNEYLDLHHDQIPKNRQAKTCNRYCGNDYDLIYESNCRYDLLDIIKTRALNETRKITKTERQLRPLYPIGN